MAYSLKIFMKKISIHLKLITNLYNKVCIGAFCLLGYILFPVTAAIAAGNGTVTMGNTNIQSEVTKANFFQADLGVLVTRIVNFTLIIGAIAALIYLLYGAIEWIISGGDKSKYETARNNITAAVIGLAILAVTWVIWLTILYFFGFQNLPGFHVSGL